MSSSAVNDITHDILTEKNYFKKKKKKKEKLFSHFL